MRWKQFFTPVKSFDAEKARKYIADRSSDELVILDVRQPKEYEAGHIPGAKLIPLPDLTERLGEIDSDKETIVYCAIGGRSRVATQMLAGKGFKNIYNLAGGFKAWNGEAAFGAEEKGLELFSGNEAEEKTLIIAYSLESGLRDFYLSMISEVDNEDVRNLFTKLADIEVVHQRRLFDEYSELTKKSMEQEEFESDTVKPFAEGGLTTSEYMNLFQPDLSSMENVIELAMSIEAQALDLYIRAAERSDNPQSEKILKTLADEERAHLTRLGKLIEDL